MYAKRTEGCEVHLPAGRAVGARGLTAGVTDDQTAEARVQLLCDALMQLPVSVN